MKGGEWKRVPFHLHTTLCEKKTDKKAAATTSMSCSCQRWDLCVIHV